MSAHIVLGYFQIDTAAKWYDVRISNSFEVNPE